MLLGRCTRIDHARPFVGVFKSQFTIDLSNFDNNFPQNGSKNEDTAPRTRTGCPHEGPSVVPRRREEWLGEASPEREGRLVTLCSLAIALSRLP